MGPRWILSVAISSVCVLAAVAPAGAARLHARVVGSLPVGEAITSDGRRFLARRDGSGLTVRNVATGARRTIPASPGCSWAGTVRAGTALFDCSAADASPSHPPLGDGYAVRLSDGATQRLPTLRGTLSDDDIRYVDIGRRWAMAYRSGYHYHAAVYVNRATGTQIENAPAGASNQRVNLNAPELTEPLCAPVRPPLQVDASGIGLEAGDIAVNGQWTAASYAIEGSRGILGTTQLQRCGHKPVVLKRCTDGFCPVPQLDDRVVIWLDGTSTRARLHVRSLHAGRTRVLVIPIPPRTFPTAVAALVAHRIYVQAGPKLLRIQP